MDIVSFQKKVFQLPLDIQRIIREYGIVQVNNYLIYMQKLPRKYLSIDCILYRTKRKNVVHDSCYLFDKKFRKNKRKNEHSISSILSKSIVIKINIKSDRIQYIMRRLVQYTYENENSFEIY